MTDLMNSSGSNVGQAARNMQHYTIETSDQSISVLSATSKIRSLISDELVSTIAINLLDALDQSDNPFTLKFVTTLEEVCSTNQLNNSQFGELCTYIVHEGNLRPLESGHDSNDVDLTRFDERNSTFKKHTLQSKIEQILSTYGI